MRTLASALCLLLATHAGVAAASVPLGYVVERWSVEEGLPNNALTSVIQTRDGYLWIGTWAGITRFDGVRFTTVAAALPNDHARALLEDADGSVWIGLSGTGVARWRSSGFDVVTPAQGLAGARFFPDENRVAKFQRLCEIRFIERRERDRWRTCQDVADT